MQCQLDIGAVGLGVDQQPAAAEFGIQITAAVGRLQQCGFRCFVLGVAQHLARFHRQLVARALQGGKRSPIAFDHNIQLANAGCRAGPDLYNAAPVGRVSLQFGADLWVVVAHGLERFANLAIGSPVQAAQQSWIGLGFLDRPQQGQTRFHVFTDRAGDAGDLHLQGCGGRFRHQQRGDDRDQR